MKAKYYKPETATCTQAFFDMADNAFQHIHPEPSMTHADIMFESGKRYVVEWMRDFIKNSAQDNRINRQIDNAPDS